MLPGISVSFPYICEPYSNAICVLNLIKPVVVSNLFGVSKFSGRTKEGDDSYLKYSMSPFKYDFVIVESCLLFLSWAKVVKAKIINSDMENIFLILC